MLVIPLSLEGAPAGGAEARVEVARALPRGRRRPPHELREGGHGLVVRVVFGRGVPVVAVHALPPQLLVRAMNCSQLLVAVPRVRARRSQTQGLSRVMRRLLMIMRSCVCPPNKRTAVVLRNPRPGASQLGAVPNEASRPAATRTGRRQGAAPSDIHAKLKATQAKRSLNLDGQRRPFLRQWARSALRSGRRSAWASPCAATHVPPRPSGNLGRPRRSGRRRGLRAARGVLSHRRDLISGARRRSRHRRDLISDAAEPHYTQKR